jgi:hypothetical protein
MPPYTYWCTATAKAPKTLELTGPPSAPSNALQRPRYPPIATARLRPQPPTARPRNLKSNTSENEFTIQSYVCPQSSIDLLPTLCRIDKEPEVDYV